MLGQKNWIVIYLKPHELEIFTHASQTSQIVPLPQQLVNNFEVLDRDGLYSLVAGWAKERPYQSTEVAWILSPSVIYEQKMEDSVSDRWDTMTVKFLDSVPFEEVLSKTYPQSGGRYVVASNGDLINSLIRGFAMQGYITKLVIPEPLAKIKGPITQATLSGFLSNISELMADNLITPEEPNNRNVKSDNKVETARKEQKPKSSLRLLIIIFAFLVAILVIVVLLNYR